MDELQKLYDLLVREGKYTKSFDDFKTKWGSEQGYQDKVFEVVSRDGFYTKDKNSFLSKYGMPAEEVKKKEGLVLPPSPSPNATDLPLGIGSLEYAKPTKPVQEGPTEKVSVGPMGMVGLERTKEYVPAKEQGKQGVILNTVSSLDKGFYKNLIGSPVKGLGTLLEGVTGKGFVSDALIKFGDYFNKTIDELTPQDEEFKNTLTDQFGQAFGQVASLIVTSGVAGLASKAPTAAGAAQAALAARTAPTAGGVASALKTLGSELASPVSISAGLSMGQSEFERAKQAGATDEQAFEAFYKNAAVGSVLERIPVMQFLKRFDKASAGGITNYIKTKGVAGLTGGFEEMTTEILQGIYANLTAQDIYDANQDIFEGIGEAGGVGFGVGFLLNAMGANARILRNQGREEEAQVVENQIAQFESQAANGGVSSYKMGGVKIESPEIISNMIDNMSAADLTRANIEIENDPELNNKLQNKIITSSVKEQVRQGNPDLNEASLDAITNLELELRKLEGNTTQTGKDKAAAIRTQIKNIQENQLTEEVDNSARIAELEAVLSSADRNLAETGFTSLSQDARVEIEKELQDLKTKQNVQEQTAGQVPVQSGTEDSGKMEEGKPQAEPQVTTEEGGQEKEVAPEMTERDEDNERVRLGDKVFEAKKNIARASDTEAAIEEYNAAKKKLEDFEASIQQRKDKKRSQSNIESLIDDENTAYQREGYEYKDLYDQDPRLAALQNAKDMVSFIESGGLEEMSIRRGESPEEAKKDAERSIKVNQQDIVDLEADLEANPVVSSKTQEAAPVTEAVLEIEQYEPITEQQVSHEKKFNKNTAIDYEEDTRETDSGREVTYLSRVTVEALDDNSGDVIGGLVKIVDEDKNVSWQAVDLDGNDLGKEDFDSLEEAKTALVKNWNKIQKKEFDKEAKKKAKEAAKKSKKIYETLPTKRVQPESGVVQPKAKAEIKPTGLAVPSGPSTKREEVKGSIQRIANAGLLRSAETGKPAITEQEIDVQMALTDAMASVWEETTGKNNFYETFISDVKEGDVEAIKQKGGALFQNTEVPQRPISRVTLAVFEEPLFQNMKGAMVAPQSISDFMKSKGKQIEKDIINNVLSYDKYKGQKRISFDEFRDDVETQIMKLERIDSKSYSDYGMDNLGDNHSYGKDQTIIFNSPIDHGQYGHFRGDFTKGQLNDVTWEVRQIPNTEQYVAIDADMPPGTPSNQIAQYVGTAGSIEEVNKWVSDRTSLALDAQINKGLFGHIRNWFNQNTGVYTLAELQSDYFQKNKANDLYASKISQDEVNEYVNKNFRRKLDNETTEAIKKEFGIVVDYTTNENGDTIATATIKNNPNIPSDYILAQNRYSTSYVPVSGFTLEDVSENQTVVEALRTLAASVGVFKDTDVAARRREIVNEYEAKRLEIKKEENKYIAKRIEEIKKSEPANLMMSQFIASQKVHELRLFRESLKHAADKGATELWFPTPYTIAVIEGYVSSNGNAPYEVINGDENYLVPGDTIEYGGTEMTVVESNRLSITVAPSDEVSVYDIDSLREDETDGRMDELEYSLKRQVGNLNTITREQVEEYDTDEFLSEQIKTSFIEWFDNNPEEEYATWSEIEDEVRDYVSDYYNDMSVEDLVSWASEIYMEGDTVYAVENRRSTERLGQASEYESQVDEDDFEGDLSEEQYTVVKKYEELGKMIRKMRPDAEVVTDNNGKRWLKTAITEADASNPIIAFQEEGGKIKGAVDFSNDNRASIYIFDGADISTLAHEMSGHIGRRVLEQLSMVDEKFAKDYEYAKKWAGVKDNQWSRAAEEKWARGFEKYLRTGKAPNAKLKDVFEKLRTWLTNIYKTIKGSSIDIKLTPEITRVFDNLLTTKTKNNETVRPQQTGDRTGRPTLSPIAPLEGAPSVPGVNGPDPQLVAVADQYAQENGIPFKRQAEYVTVDEDRAIRISEAYEAMADDPQNPKVKEAYQNLINQTMAQYKALADAGYKFWFMDLNIPSNAEYASTPFNAIRDLRANKEMGVFPTTDGYGDGGLTELNVEKNPLLADTGIQWPVGGLDGEMKTVLANDLFRAVHDAFGHGLEGSGFRARGEENAWQAHVRLFTGSAIAAMTSETRGQNSWLNYGPNGEQNRTASVDDTVFAEQKIGLMPSWTWTEGKAADMKSAPKPKQRAAPIVEEEVAPTEEDLSSIDALLDLDVDDDDNMLRVLNALDKVDNSIKKRLRGSANDALLAIPLSTIQLVVKTLKALVKGGMMLRDAIRKVATDNSVSQQIVKDILNVSEIQEGFDALMVKVDEMIARQTRRGTPEARMVSNIDTLVRNSEVYQNANDAQKKILEREARARAGVSARRAPSIGRILGVLKDITNVSRQDKLAIISKIRQLSKDAAKDLAAEIKELAKGGKITANQAANIVARFGKVNMLSEISVSKFVDYMTKVFNDAEYASKLSKAKSTKKDIAKLSKNKDKDANLRELGKEFAKIDPSMVENIDEYNDMASKIKEAIKGSTIRGQKVSFAETVNIENATEYIKKTLDAQDKMMRAEKAAEIQSLMGIDVSDFSYDDMMMLLEGDKPITKYNEGIIRSTINKAFSVFSSIIKESISTGKDPFTGEDVKFTESQKDVVKRFMAMDLNILKPKESLQAVDALANFLQNQSTAKMEAVVSKYTGIANAAEVNEKGIVASPLKKYWSKTIGRILGEQTTNLNVLFERMFKGFNKGGFVMDKMGLTKLINKKSFAQKQANNIVDAYVEKFYKLKANGEAFNSAYNNIERGMAAFMMRNVIGTEQEMKAEFNRRKNLMEESISALEKGNEKERERAKLYQQAYDNILKDSKNIDDIKKKTDKVNLDGIDFWMNEWANKFEQLSDVSENVYNKVLDKDINYTPDRFYKLSSDTGTVEIGEDDSAFIANSGLSNLYQRATGVLMTAVRPETLPVNPESGDVNRYIDLSFDNNNSNSMYDALVDINTAAPIRQIQAFLNSSDFKKIVPTSEDAKILKDRIQLYVRNIRDKNPYSNDELSSVVRKLNKIAAIGVGQALGGITQPIKQVIPVAINTLINGGGLDLSASFNQAKNAFINNSGYAIASRGLESQAQIESLNKLIDEVSETKGEKLMAGIEKLNKWWLDKFLVKPDVFIARASWLTYYEQSLQKKGIETKGLDYSTHQLNEDAANYAQRMVDRQQNISDTDLAGKLFASRESANQLLVKTLMPFASFRMNQSARLGADLATITNKTSTKEDKKVAWRSVGGFASEMVTFRLVSIGISVLLGSLAKEIMGVDEDDEEKQKRIDNIVKGAKTGTFTDIFSPVPIADKLVQSGGALITQSIEDATGLPTAIYSPRKEEFLQNAGLFGIAADRAAQLWEISNLATTGEYTDDFGKEKTISSDAQEGLSFLIPAAILTNIGLAPSEVNTIVRYAIKDSKKSRKSSQEKAEKAERKQDTEETKKQKLDAFENVKQETSDPAVLDAIDEKIKELRATSEQKKQIEKKNKAERVMKQSLLVDPETGEEYDTETEMKRYNKDLWEKNFGENSEWYQSHEAEKEATKLLNKEIRKMEDEEYDYTAPAKKKRARNSDGTFKRKGGFGSAKFGGG